MSEIRYALVKTEKDCFSTTYYFIHGEYKDGKIITEDGKVVDVSDKPIYTPEEYARLVVLFNPICALIFGVEIIWRWLHGSR